MMIGKPIKLWDKKIPKSGKSILNFAGETLHIKELKLGTWVIHVETKAIIGFFSKSWTRERILDYIASRIDEVKAIRSHSFYSGDLEDTSADKDASDASFGNISMTHYSDGTPVKPRQNKKFYDVTQHKGW